MTASFLNVGQKGKFKLSDIKLRGYEEQFPDGTSSDFNFCRLTAGGSSQQDLGNSFYWEDLMDGNGGYWCDADSVPVTKDNDYEFDAAEAVWFTSPAAEDESFKFYFENAGQVATEDTTFDLRDDGNVIGNPFPYVIKLSDITIDGYQKQYPDGTSSDFNFCRLTAGGSSQQDLGNSFYWEDLMDGNGGYWCDADSVPVDKENDYEIAIGEGLWFTAPAAEEDPDSDGKTYKFVLEFPAYVTGK